MVSWPLQNRSWVVKTLQRQCPLLVEPEPGPCLWVPTRTNAPTGPHYCCRQLSLMSSRVSDSMQLLQMALPSHLALPLSIYRRWETCQWPTSLQRERKRSVMEFSTIWSQHSTQTQHSESLRMVKQPPKSHSNQIFFGLFLMSVSICLEH